MPSTPEQQKARYYANLEENRRKHREYARENRDRLNEKRRQLRARDGDRIREAERNRGRQRDSAARYRDRHGRWVDEDKAAMWDSQGGRCYLCGEEMDPGVIDIDHDHSCCPQGKSCRACRRGLTHHRCNVVIGWGTRRSRPAAAHRGQPGSCAASVPAAERRRRTAIPIVRFWIVRAMCSLLRPI